MLWLVPTVAYIPEYSYEYGYAHVLFVWKLESDRPKLKRQKDINPIVKDLLNPLSVVSNTPWISSTEKNDDNLLKGD